MAGLPPPLLAPKDLDFIFTCLRKKLAVGKRSHVVFPAIPATCAPDGALKNMYHRTKACTWLTVPLRILQCTSVGRAPL